MELKASDLRIGNWINKNGFERKVTCHDLVDFDKNCTNDYKPIPLTEQWLIDFGFSKKSAGDITYYAKNGFNLKFSEYIKEFIYFEFVEVGSGESDFDICDLYFVHQIQNLYFALQGKELTK